MPPSWMPSWTPEREVSPEMALALVRDQFPALGAGAPPAIERIGVGWDNVAYLVGGRFVFRFPQRSIAVPLLETESCLLPVVAPRLPLPAPLPVFFGRPSAGYPWPFHGYERVAGRSACGAALDERARERAAAPLGGFLRVLHSFPVEEAGRLGAPGDTLGRADLPKRVRHTRARLAEVRARRLGADGAAFDDICAEADDERAALPSPALVHGDLYARHLLVSEAGDLSGVIDWGDMHLGHPALDLSIAFGFLPAVAWPAFFAAYGGVPPQGALCRARLQALFYGVTLLLYGSETADRDLVREARLGLGYLADGR
jgi:aminoglycoside phosphotransferase (APT) family kinase protein